MLKDCEKREKFQPKKNRKKIFKIISVAILVIFGASIFITILYRWINPPVTPLMVIRKISDGATIEKNWVNIEDISPYMISSAVAAEDNNFLGHHGFDLGAIQKVVNERKRGIHKRGASTISQQTAKNVFLWPRQSWVRKGCEVYFTFLIETFWSKERIMEVYLNIIEMGDGVYGCDAAAHKYFHKSARRLTKREASLITACYPNPRRWNPAKPTKYINGRANKISALIPKFGKIKFDDKSIKKAQKRYNQREERRTKRNNGKVLDL